MSTDLITVTVSDAASTALTATALSALGGKTAGVVTVSNAVAITGLASDLTAALVTDETKVLAATATVTVSNALTGAADISTLNAIAGKTSGIVTATLSGTDIELASLTTVGTDAISVTVSNGSAAAANINTINAATSVAVNLDAVTAIGGSASDVATVYTAQTNLTVSGLGNETVTLSAGSAWISDLMTIYAGTNVIVGATAVTDIGGSGADFSTLVLAASQSEISLSGTFNAHLTGISTVNDLFFVDGATTGTLLTDAVTDTVTYIKDLLSSLNSTALINSITGAITVNGTSLSETIDMSSFGTLHGLTIEAAGGNDSIIGTGLSDIINGGSGADEIIGAGGADTINGGQGADRFIYDSILDSTITTTVTATAGFDQVTFDNTDSFSFSYTLTGGHNGVDAVTSLVTVGENMASTGSLVISQLNTAFQAHDNNVSDYEASLVKFIDKTFLVLDSDKSNSITASDQIIEIVGTANSLSIVAGDVMVS